jgi:hypothetical protein
VKYTVKNSDGQLTYGSMEEVKTAYVLGLVEPEDEVLEDGSTMWRKAGAIPLLVTARKVSNLRGHSNALRGWVIGALVLSFFAFYFLIKGSWIWGGLTALGVVVLLIQVTVVAAKKPKR